MEIDPFIFRMSIFILSIFIGYYVVWSVTPSLHTPLMSVTNAISSVIIVGAIIAGLSGDTKSIFDTSNVFGFAAIFLAAINIFGGFLVTQRMLQMYKKKKKNKYVSKFISIILFNLWHIIYSSFERSIFSWNFKKRELFWYCWNGNFNNCYFFICRKFWIWFYLCAYFSCDRWVGWCIYSF